MAKIPISSNIIAFCAMCYLAEYCKSERFCNKCVFYREDSMECALTDFPAYWNLQEAAQKAVGGGAKDGNK